MTRARIIFVPGLKPKPPPNVYRPALLRVLQAALERVRPATAARFAADPDAFELIAWTFLFYGSYRDFELDRDGLERLLAQREPSTADLREIDSWARALLRLTHIVGDALPAIGRLVAQPATRLTMHEANRYLKDDNKIGTSIRWLVRDALDAAWRDGCTVLLLGHSLGSVIAFDTLWELSHERPTAGKVDLFVTMGSPLATHFVQRKLHGAVATGAERYPTNIRRWVNFAAQGDTTALQSRLKPHYQEMVDLGLVESIEDHVGLKNFFRGSIGLNVHEAYGYLAQPELAVVLADWLDASS